MNKTLWATLLFVMTLLFVAQAHAATLVIADLDPVLLKGNVLDVLSGKFTVENKGTSEVKATIEFKDFTIAGKGSIPSTAFSYSPSPLVTIPAGQKATVTYTLSVPSNAFSGTYNGGINVFDNADATNKVTADLSIFVNEKPSFTATTPAKKIILQGKNDILSLNLTNTGNIDLKDITLTLSDLVSGSNKISKDSSMIKVTAEPVTLLYSNTTQATKEYQVKVFVDAAQAVGVYTGELIFKSAKLPDGIKTVATVEVQAVVDAVTLTATAGQMKVKTNSIISNTPITLTVANTGNTDQDVTLQAVTLTSGTNSLTITPAKTKVSVKAGQTETVTYAASQAVPVGTYTGVIIGTYGGKTANANAQFSVSDALSNADFPTFVNMPSSPTDKGTDVTAEFTFKNTGDTDLTNIVLTTKNIDNTKYDVKFSTDGNFYANPLSIGSIKKDQTITVKVKGKIPTTEQPGLHKIGDISFTTTELTRTASLQLNVKSFLEIKEVKMEFDGSKESVTANGVTIDNKKAKPGAPFSVDIEVCNRFAQNNNKIKDILVEATWLGIDDGEDIEGESATFDLSEDKCRSVSVKMDKDTIPFFVDQTTYDLVIEVEGEDKNSTTHRDTWTVPVQINKETDSEMKIFDVKLNPSTISCEGTISLDVVAYNIGDDGNDDGRFTIISPLLGINYAKDFDFGSDADDDCDAIDEPDEQCLGFDHTFTFDITDDVAPGKYAINLKTYHDDTKEDDSRSVDLEVKACGAQTPSSKPSGTTTPPAATTTPPATTVVTPQPNVSSQPVVVFTTPSSTTSAPAQASPPTRIVDLTKTLENNDTYLLLLVIANVLLLVLLFVAIAKAVRR